MLVEFDGGATSQGPGGVLGFGWGKAKLPRLRGCPVLFGCKPSNSQRVGRSKPGAKADRLRQPEWLTSMRLGLNYPMVFLRIVLDTVVFGAWSSLTTRRRDQNGKCAVRSGSGKCRLGGLMGAFMWTSASRATIPSPRMVRLLRTRRATTLPPASRGRVKARCSRSFVFQEL